MGLLCVVTEGGELVLVEAAPDAHRKLRRVPGIEGKTWNVPVISGGILLVRNASEMAAFDLCSGQLTQSRRAAEPQSRKKF